MEKEGFVLCRPTYREPYLLVVSSSDNFLRFRIKRTAKTIASMLKIIIVTTELALP